MPAQHRPPRRGIKGRFFSSRTKAELRHHELPKQMAAARKRIRDHWAGGPRGPETA